VKKKTKKKNKKKNKIKVNPIQEVNQNIKVLQKNPNPKSQKSIKSKIHLPKYQSKSIVSHYLPKITKQTLQNQKTKTI